MKKIHNYRNATKTSISAGKLTEGESIEKKLRRIMTEKSGIEQISPMIYTERKDGVLPMYDIRSDKFDLALEAMDKVAQIHASKRKERQDAKIIDLNKDKKGPETGANTSDGGPKS